MPTLSGWLEYSARSGEWLSIASGFAWAVGIILFRISGRKVTPIGLNVFKNLIALFLIIPTVLLLRQEFDPDLPPRVLPLFLLSGVLGIAISDTLFLAALNKLGAGLLAIVDCLYSPFVIILSFIFLGERMTAWQIIGALLVVSAVLTVSKAGGDNGGPKSRKELVSGMIIGILAMVLVAISIILVKPYLGMVSTSWATMARLTGGLAALFIFLPFYKGRRAALKPLFKLNNWKVMIPAAFFGTYLSLVLWMGGMKYTQASIAAVLNQLNVVFTVILAVLFLKERMTRWKILAVVLALAGAWLAAGKF